MASETQGKLSTRDAIRQVLTEAGKPMTVSDIFAAAMPLTNLSGATPKQTFYGVLYAENKKGQAGGFQRVGEGKFRLRQPKPEKQAKPQADGAK